VIGISVKQLNNLLGKELSPESLSETLEQLGCDLEGIAEVACYECPRCNTLMDKWEDEEPPKKCTNCGHQAENLTVVGHDQVIRLDLLPARPDLFDAGGLTRAIKGYLEIETGLPEYKVEKSDITVSVDSKLKLKESYRPFIGCAVVTMPKVDSILLRTLMKLQENLHWGIGRDRKLCSIGIYDLSTIAQPIRYTTVAPEAISFCALGQPGIHSTPAQILKEHPKGKSYAHLLEGLKAYPLLIDSKEQVLSMPPIINSDETRLKIGSTGLFIDVTGITPGDVKKSLSTLVSSLLEMGGKAQSVKISSEEKEYVSPDLSPGKIAIHSDMACKWLGLDMKTKDIFQYLARMRLGVSGKSPHYKVSYPAYRTDIKHEVDIFEDLAIAYGYHHIVPKLIPTLTVAEEREEEKISCQARDVMLGLGFDEAFSLMLTTHETHFHKLRLSPSTDYVLLLNSKSVDHNMMRKHLMTGLLESLAQNRLKSVPQKFFEIGNVVLINEESQTGTIEERRLAYVILSPSTGYAEARSILDAILREIGRKGEYKKLSHPSFIEGRCAEVALPNHLSAYLGEIHPEVLQNFGLSYPVTFAEVTLARLFGEKK
jgi:phenylalanyl-tRNA synthetase beta chain